MNSFFKKDLNQLANQFTRKESFDKSIFEKFQMWIDQMCFSKNLKVINHLVNQFMWTCKIDQCESICELIYRVEISFFIEF